MSDLLAPMNQANFKTMRELFERSHKVGLGGALIGDLSQSAHRQRLGPWFPSLARSTMNVSISKSHVFTPAEIEFSMGWPVCAVGDAPSYASCVPPEIIRLSFNERSIRSGNGMNLAQVYAWALFVCTHIVRRSDVEKLMPQLRFKRRRLDAEPSVAAVATATKAHADEEDAEEPSVAAVATDTTKHADEEDAEEQEVGDADGDLTAAPVSGAE